MALIPQTFAADLISIFSAMDNILDGTGDEYQAEKMATAIKIFILTGQVATVDAGTLSGNTYSGAGNGIMTIDEESLKDDLQPTFEAKYSNDQLAAQMATDIDNACKADDTVTTTNSGGSGLGKFTGDKSIIENILKACFSTMNGMMSGGGNEYYAAQLSMAVETYLKDGDITVTLLPPFSAGAGTGKIA